MQVLGAHLNRRLGRHSSLVLVEVVDRTLGHGLAVDKNLGRGRHPLIAKNIGFGSGV